MIPLANADVTLYMQHKTGGVISWSRIVLSEVFFQQKAVRSHDSSGVLRFSRVTTMRVDQDISLVDDAGSSIDYSPPEEFDAAPDVSGLWTLKKGDVLVLGAQTQEIDEGYGVEQLRRDYGTYATIQAVADLRGGPLGHWQVDAL